jgi:hypothetical protein
MDKVLELGARPHIRVEMVRRDLRVQAGDGQEVLLRSGSDTTEVEQVDGVTVIRTPASLRLQLPPDSILEIGQVGGDLAMEGLQRDCHIGQVGGDARIEHSAGLLIDRVGGDCLARMVQGDIVLKAAGGDVVLEQVSGSAKVSGAGGDVVLGEMGGEIQVAVGGDATVNLQAGLSGEIEISSGGDSYCRLPAQPSISASLTAGGDLRVTGSDVPSVDWGQAEFELHGGDHRFMVSAGGDLWLALGESDEIPVGMADIGGTIAAKVGEKIAEMEAALSAMGAELNGVSSELISDRVQRIVDRAVKRHEHLEARVSLHEALEKGFARSAGASDEERMKVLQMLEEKVITVEQAEELLEALEG